MSHRDITFYVVDIFIAIDKVKRYTEKFENGSELLYDEVHWDATIRELEIIGEATKYLLKDELIDAKYRRIVDFRNQILHGYFGIDENIVWDVVKNKLSEYEVDLKHMLLEEEMDLSLAVGYAKDEYENQRNVLRTLENIKNWVN